MALDVLPLAGERTGVGRFCAGLLGGLAGRDDVHARGYALSRHARATVTAPAAVAGLAGRELSTWPLPSRAVNLLWSRVDAPPVEWLTGKVAVVHGTNFVVPPARHAARVMTVHDLAAMRYPHLCSRASRSYPGLVRRAADRGAFVHVPSGFVAGEVTELLDIDPSRVRVVPHGIDPLPGEPPANRSGRASVTEPEERHRSAGRSRPYVLAIGTIEPRKDLPTLVAAFTELAGSHRDLELVVAGPDGWGTSAFTAAVEASSERRRIVRLGYLGEDERVALLRGAAVLAYPSLYEGFGFPPLEAMAAGVPVVASSAGAIAEVVGNAAELAPPGDATALAAAIARVLEEGRRAELVSAGRARAATFTWQACAEGLARLYLDAATEAGTA